LASVRPISLHRAVLLHRAERPCGVFLRDSSTAASNCARATPSEVAAKAHAVDRVGRNPVERALLAQIRAVVAQRGEFLGDEEVVDRIGIGAGAAQPDHVPDVVQRALPIGNRMVRSSGEPSGFLRGVPSASVMRTWAPSPARLADAGGELPAPLAR
jgi:hypothetical protein